MKRYCFYIVSLLIALTFTGCVKDDNPFPDIQYTTWKRVYGNSWQRVSFSAGRVHHEIFDMMLPDTVYSYDFYADYTEETEDGRHMYSWILEEGCVRFRVFSLGPDNVVIDTRMYGEGPSIGDFDMAGQLYYRDADPAEGYNF